MSQNGFWSDRFGASASRGGGTVSNWRIAADQAEDPGRGGAGIGRLGWAGLGRRPQRRDRHLDRKRRRHGHEPYACFKNLLERLPGMKVAEIDALLPVNCQPFDQAVIAARMAG